MAVLILCLSMLPACATLYSMGGSYDAFNEDDAHVVAAAIEQIVANQDRDGLLEPMGSIASFTDVVRQAIRMRAARASLVDELLSSGHFWERKNGLLYVIRTSEYKNQYTKGEKDRHAILINAENDNRWEIYEGLLAANNLNPENLDRVRQLFFEERITLMKVGQQYENADGIAVAASR